MGVALRRKRRLATGIPELGSTFSNAEHAEVQNIPATVNCRLEEHQWRDFSSRHETTILRLEPYWCVLRREFSGMMHNH